MVLPLKCVRNIVGKSTIIKYSNGVNLEVKMDKFNRQNLCRHMKYILQINITTHRNKTNNVL